VLDCARCQAGVLAEGIACGLVVGPLSDSRIVQTGISMHRRVFSMQFMKDLSLYACAVGRLFLSSSRSS
jgi:hypothetical protein